MSKIMGKLGTGLIALLLMFALPVQAEQSKKFGHLEVHYIALPSTFLTPDVAKSYGITRSRYTGILNISVLNKNMDSRAITAALAGTAKNLLGNRVDLDFREVKEGQAIYYIAEVPHRNEETYRFDINITADKKSNTLKFEHKFYVD